MASERTTNNTTDHVWKVWGTPRQECVWSLSNTSNGSKEVNDRRRKKKKAITKGTNGIKEQRKRMQLMKTERFIETISVLGNCIP